MTKQILIAFFFLLAAQLPAQDDAITKGYKALQNKQYSEAETQFNTAVKETPEDWQAWLLLGAAQIGLEQYKIATGNLKKALELSSGRQSNEPKYKLAQCYLGLKDPETACKYLNDMAQNGAPGFYANRIDRDEAFEAIKNNPEMLAIKEQLKKNSTPCLYDPNCQHFDFWIGVWDVYLQNTGTEYDTKVAVDSVAKSPGGCSVIEFFDMTPPSNYWGRSFSFYDDVKKVFRHQWAGSQGDIVNYEVIESKKDTVILLATTTVPDKKEQLRLRRMTMSYQSADETVHQFIENSYDQGKTWAAEWDALFRRKK